MQNEAPAQKLYPHAKDFCLSLWQNPKGQFNRVAMLLAATLLAAVPMSVRAGAFSVGDLALVVSASVTLANTTCSIVEINTTLAGQTAVQTIAIPGTGANAIRVSGSSTSTLYLAGSSDGSLLCFTGINLDGNTSGNANALNPRAVVTLDAAGTMAIPTTYTGGSGNQTRCATTLDKSTWYVADAGGIYTNGSASSINSANPRCLKPFGGTLYTLLQSSVATNSAIKMVSLDAKNLTPLPGLTNDTTAQDFYLISSGNNGSAYDVLYITRNTSATVGAITKFSLVGGVWVANGTNTTTFGGYGICAAKSGSGAALYVTTGTGATAANSVIKLTDTAGYNTPIAITAGNNVTLYTTAAGTSIKGIAFAPVASSPSQISYLAINSMSLSQTNLLLGGTNTGAGTFYVLTSTNVALPRTNWISVATNVASGTGNFNLIATNAVSPALPQQFYLLSTTNNF